MAASWTTTLPQVVLGLEGAALLTTLVCGVMGLPALGFMLASSVNDSTIKGKHYTVENYQGPSESNDAAFPRKGSLLSCKTTQLT